MSSNIKKWWEDFINRANNVKDTVVDWGKGVASDIIDAGQEKLDEVEKLVNPIPSPYESGEVKDVSYTPYYYSTEQGKIDLDAYLGSINDFNTNVKEFQYSDNQAYKDALAALTGREKFNYDLNSDALYQQYAEQYRNMGKLASEDVMGQAAMLTGGYGNSYAATAGNQAYQSYLNQLNNMVPELYNSALNAYNAEGQRLADNVNMYMQDYAKEYSDWQGNYDYYMGRVDNARNTYMNNADLHMDESDRVNSAISENNKNAVDNAIWNENNRLTKLETKEKQDAKDKAEKDQAAQDAYKAYLDTLDLYSEFNADKLRENQEIHYREKGVTSFYEDAVSALDEIKANATSAEDYVDNVIDYIDDMYNKSFISPEEKEKLGKYLARGTSGSPYPTVVQDLTILLYDKYGPNGAGKQAKINELLGKLRDAGILSKEQYDRWSKPL